MHPSSYGKIFKILKFFLSEKIKQLFFFKECEINAASYNEVKINAKQDCKFINKTEKQEWHKGFKSKIY